MNFASKSTSLSLHGNSTSKYSFPIFPLVSAEHLLISDVFHSSFSYFVSLDISLKLFPLDQHFLHSAPMFHSQIELSAQELPRTFYSLLTYIFFSLNLLALKVPSNINLTFTLWLIFSFSRPLSRISVLNYLNHLICFVFSVLYHSCLESAIT